MIFSKTTKIDHEQMINVSSISNRIHTHIDWMDRIYFRGDGGDSELNQILFMQMYFILSLINYIREHKKMKKNTNIKEHSQILFHTH